GWDELPPARRRQVAAWLQVLMTAYPGNKLVVAGPVRGYRPLQEIGLAPVFLMPWSASEFAELGRLWAAAWPEIGGTPREPALEPEPDLVRLAIRGNRSRSPLDATLKLWATFAGDDPGEGRQGWYSAYVNRIIPAPELRGALEQAAEMILSSEEEAIGLSIAEFTRLVDQAREESGGRTVRTPDFIYTITNETHLLTEHPGKRLSFTQPVIGAYLAAEALREAPFREELLARESFNTLVMPFLSQMQDVTPYVQRLLGEGNTILKEDWLYLAAWATDASLKAPWRGEAFKRMAQLLLAPVQFPLTRERAMAALVASRDLNVGFVFRQGLKSQDPRIRILAALGLGALGDPETVIALGEALNDENPAVEAAAAMALGAMGTRTALNYMIQTLLTGSELGRRAVAEMLATNIAGEGHDILREALEEQDPATRRAAIYGLELVNEEWAIKLLENAERRDDQWIVRAAAANALEALRSPNGNAPRRPPQPTEIRWLIDWLAERDESVAPGPSGISQLVRALQEGDERIRLAAAETLGALAAPEGVTPLYTALRDEHPEIRDSAYRSLGTISQASGHKLPGVL
ncbi:MAG TPA: HEAT repeat domain-containing protein, partial [Chloroflexi bacterium]|nr:HEAT repeat domain-containing protein [Chloroflexota bacterium]